MRSLCSRPSIPNSARLKMTGNSLNSAMPTSFAASLVPEAGRQPKARRSRCLWAGCYSFFSSAFNTEKNNKKLTDKTLDTKYHYIYLSRKWFSNMMTSIARWEGSSCSWSRITVGQKIVKKIVQNQTRKKLMKSTYKRFCFKILRTL